MKWVLSLVKGGMLVFWLAELANLFKLVPSPWDTILHTAVVVVLAINSVVAALFIRVHGQFLIEHKLHKMLVVLFGVVHWLDLQRSGKLPRPTTQTRHG